jgi:uncharacterized cupredoxin-like copper-binding protein
MRVLARFPVARAVGAVITLFLTSSLPAQTTAAGEKIQYARVVARDYAFEAPTTLREGIAMFHLVNQGADVHQLVLIELGVGHTVKEFFDTMRAKGQPPPWTVEVAMTPTIQPNKEAFLTTRVVPGRYILACLIPARDGRSHVEKGMFQLVTVSATSKPAPAPTTKKPSA